MYLFDENRYNKLEYRKCGNSGLYLPPISLGLWHNFGGYDVFEQGREIILKAFDSGITHFDLANNYGPPPGSAEETFGKILKNDLRNHRDELIISTKAGWRMWPGPYGDGGSKKYLIASLDQSLRRLGVDYVDIFYSHRFDGNTPLDETIEALYAIVHQGKALYVGISSYSDEQTKQVVNILKKYKIKLLVHQPSYSLLNRGIENRLVNVLQQYKIGCITFSPLAQGLLTGKYLNGIPKDSRAANPYGYLKKEAITEDKLEKVKKLNEIAKNRGQTLAQMSIAWILSHDFVTSVLVGCRTLEQFNENLDSLKNINFTKEELNLIDEITK